MKLQAAKAFSNPPAAIVQVAKNNAYYEKAIETCDALHAQERARIIKEWKESKTWQDKYDTWEAACELVLDMTSRHTNRLIASVSDDSGHSCPVSTDKSAKAELKALKNIEKARENDDGEKPTVHAATPEQMRKPPKNADEWERKEHYTAPKPTNVFSNEGLSKPSENGKPKHSLAIWKELEEVHFGRALNRIDELNRQCPNPKYHAQLIAKDKECIAILEQWRQEVK